MGKVKENSRGATAAQNRRVRHDLDALLRDDYDEAKNHDEQAACEASDQSDFPAAVEIFFLYCHVHSGQWSMPGLDKTCTGPASAI